MHAGLPLWNELFALSQMEACAGAQWTIRDKGCVVLCSGVWLCCGGDGCRQTDRVCGDCQRQAFTASGNC